MKSNSHSCNKMLKKSIFVGLFSLSFLFASGQQLQNLMLLSSSGNNLDSDTLVCNYELTGGATTSVTSWYCNNIPFALLQLPFEGGAGNAYNDYSGNSNSVIIPAIAGNDPEIVPASGYNGFGSVYFDGNDFLNAGKIFPISSYTKMVWVYHTSNGNYDNIISGGTNAANNHFLKVNPTGLLNAGHNGSSYTVCDQNPVLLNTWTHVAVTYNATTGRMLLYRNGVQVDAATIPENLRVVIDSTVLIGAMANSFGWHGNIDQVYLFNKTLSPTQIASFYRTQNKIVPAETTSGDRWNSIVVPFSVASAGVARTSNGISIDIPTLGGIALGSSSGFNLDTDTLICKYSIIPCATTSATTWYRNNLPFSRLYLPFEGGINNAYNDYSGNGNVITIPAVPTNDPAFAPTGGHNGHGAIHFDGNDYLTGGNIFPTGSSYTKTAWIYNSGNGAIEHNILSGINTENNHTFKVSTSGSLNAGHVRGTFYVMDPAPLELNRWYFVAVTFNITNGLMILYKNGVEVSRATVAQTYRNVTDASVYVGALGNENGVGSYYMWNGYIDDVRIYNQTLTPQQINAMSKSIDKIVPEETQPSDRWQARLTPFSPTNAGTAYTTNELLVEVPGIEDVTIYTPSGNNLDTDSIKCSYNLIPSSVTAATTWYRNNISLTGLYLPMEGGITNMLGDYSGNNRSVTINTSSANNDPSFLPTGGHDGHGAINFDGTDYLTGGNIFPTGSSYTKTAWIYNSGNGTVEHNILSGTNTDNNHTFKVSTSGSLNAGHTRGTFYVMDPTPLELNRWYFVAVTFNISTGLMILYKDGVEVHRATVALTYRNVTDASVFVGALGNENGNGSYYYWNGNLDDVRIYNRELTPQQINAMRKSTDVIVPEETEGSDTWQARVTPFSVINVGATALSNILLVDIPQLSNVSIFSSSGNNSDADSLKCEYTFIPSASIAATAWYRNNVPFANLYMPFEGGNTFATNDYSGFNHPVTVGTTPQNDPLFVASGHNGTGSMNFDGNDFLDAGKIFPVNSSYTKTAWVYRTANGNYDNIISGYSLGTNNHSFKVHNTNVLTAGHNAGSFSVTDVTPLNLNTWYFVAVTYNVINGQMILYKNGVAIDTGIVAQIYRNVTDSGVLVGAMNYNYAWHGNIDDASLYNKVLTPEQIHAIYQSRNIIVPQETFPSDRWNAVVTPFSSSNAGTGYNSNVLYIDIPQISNLNLYTPTGNNQFTDSIKYSYDLISGAVTAGKSLILNGKPAQVLNLPFEGGAVDALRDYSGNNHSPIQIGTNPDNNPLFEANTGHDGHGAIHFDGNDFYNAGKIFPIQSSYTISAWVYRTSENAYDNIISSETNAPNNHYLKVNADNHLNAGHNGAAVMVYDPNPININTWYHVALTFDFYTGEMNLYKNGALVGTDTLEYQFRIITDSTVQIGALGNDYEWNGYIDDVLITNSVMPAEQIHSIYSSSNPAVVPPAIAAGDTWQVNVTPFSSINAGFGSLSNILKIEAPAVSNVSLQSRTSNFLQRDTLKCTFGLTNGARTASVAWYKNNVPHAFLYMPFEGDTLYRYDMSGNNHIATLGNPKSEPKYFSHAGFNGNGCLYFNGSNFIDAGDIFPTGSSYTKAAWIYRTAQNTWHNIMSGDRNYLNNHSFKVGNDNRLNAGHNGGNYTVRDTATIEMYKWYFVAVTYDFNTGEMVLFKNGTEVDRDTVDAEFRNVTDEGLLIGAIDSSYRWVGYLDEVQFYDFTLSPDKIKALYTNKNIIIPGELKLGDTWEARAMPFSMRNGGQIGNSAPITIHGIEVTDIPDQTVDQGQTFSSVQLNDYVTDFPYNDTQISWKAVSQELTVSIDNDTKVATIAAPYLAWFGSEEVMFIAQDPDYAIDTIFVQFTMNPINHNPLISGLTNQTINEGSLFPAINLDDFVIDAINTDNEISWQALGQNAMTVNISPSRVASVIIPGNDWYGVDTIKFVSTDPSNFTDTATVIFTVLSVNDSPIFAAIPNQSIDEGSLFSNITLSSYVTDADNASTDLTWTILNSGELTFLLNSQTSVLQIVTPDDNWFGTEQIGIVVNDIFGASDTTFVTFKVNAVNDRPFISSIPNQSIVKGGSFLPISLDTYVSDVDNYDDDLTWTYTGNINLLVNYDLVTRVITVSAPTADWVGSEEITFTVTDPGSLSANIKVTFTVNQGVSIEDQTKDKISVYPLPATDFVNVVVPASGKCIYQIYNSAGILVANNSVTVDAGRVFGLNISNLPTDEYILKIILNGRTYNKKIMVIR